MTVCSSHPSASLCLCLQHLLTSLRPFFSLPTPQTRYSQAVHQMSSDSLSLIPATRLFPLIVFTCCTFPSSAPHCLYRCFSFVLCQFVMDSCVLAKWTLILPVVTCSSGFDLLTCLLFSLCTCLHDLLKTCEPVLLILNIKTCHSTNLPIWVCMRVFHLSVPFSFMTDGSWLHKPFWVTSVL